MSNPFAILGLEPRFALTAQQIDLRQRELNRALHPDKHASGGTVQRRQALHRAMDINEACRTLRNPAARAEALLEVLGAPARGSESRASSPALLMEMMEQREALDQARRKGDADGVAALGRAMATRQGTLLGELTAVFESLQASQSTTPTQPDRFVDAFDKLSELRYVQRFSDEVRAIEDEL